MRRRTKQKSILGDVLRLAGVLFACFLVVGVFLTIYTALGPKTENNPGVLTDGTAFPTPVALEDIPLGLYLQQHRVELAAPGGDDATPVTFSVTLGELPADVAARLQGQGLIKNADLFVQWVKYLHVGNKIQAGDYVLRQTMTMDEIIEALQHGRARTVALAIRPGWRAEEVADYIGTLGLTGFTADQFLKAVKAGNYNYGFLKDRPKTASSSVEGFLFPETYNVPYDVPLEVLMTLIFNTFETRYTAKLRQEAAASNLTLYEVVTLASIVEREAAVASERSLIASVYLNRLKKKMYLQADPTVQYAIGYQAATKQWWKSPVTLEEYQKVDSPYNTYTHGGLPPGPIANPSLASITAVLEPEQTDFLFFLGRGDGSHVFAKTYEEHQANMQKYGYTK